LSLQEHAIRDTVVVYGSTRIPEPAAATRNVEALRQALRPIPVIPAYFESLPWPSGSLQRAATIKSRVSQQDEQYPNPYITPGLCFRFHYFAPRKMHLLQRAKALAAFPGGYGTFDELFEVLTLVQTRKIKPLPTKLVGERYWRRAFDADFLADEGVIEAEDRELFWFAETAKEIWDGILHWYDACGDALAATC
jgi:predicted Rossmann-fold nucleotide-binding protein